ncbi:MAG TPA: SAM-dependent methyltransferase [Clostridiaceae bacterium]|nr:SAM-dependent methyltransferase [Clostridiaceae bacterium]
MNKQNISKLRLFLTGLTNRFEEHSSIFKGIKVTFSTGLKDFNGTGSFENGDIKYNFGGSTRLLTIDKLFDSICSEAEKFESLNLIYSERGVDIQIAADNKNVRMKNVEVKETEAKKGQAAQETSTLLNRNYLVKSEDAAPLLKEIGILTKDGKVKNDKIRKYNQIDHYVELFSEIIDKIPRTKTLVILDCGCGKSYLSFVLNYYLTEVKKINCQFIGLDYKESVIENSRKIAETLGYRNMEFHAVDIQQYKPTTKINVVMSLHACDTATDMALALGIRVESDAIIAVPCCHKEMLSQYYFELLKGITKYGVLKARLADILTDGMRALLLEAKGYNVSVVEYISPLETPKNLMIRAVKVKDHDEDAMSEYFNLMAQLGVYPALYGYLNEDFTEE